MGTACMADGANKPDEAQKAGEVGNAKARVADFDAAQWHEDLLALNPWAEGLNIFNKNEFVQPRRLAMLDRWKMPGDELEDPKRRWNAWAEKMLNLRARLPQQYRLSGSLEQSAFHEIYKFTSETDFSWLCLFGGSRFNGFVFPGEANFQCVTFGSIPHSQGGITFAYSDFRGGAARFNESHFASGKADFQNAKFSGGHGWFDGVNFSGGAALFSGSEFSGGAALFKRCQFGPTSETNFYSGPIGLTENYIREHLLNGPFDAVFSAVKFASDADFSLTRFNSRANFSGSSFSGRASFRSCHSKVSFSMADCNFELVPDFVEMSFHQTPRLDNILIADQIVKTHREGDDPRPQNSTVWRRFGASPFGEDEARYRVLRKFAMDAQDHERELEFHAQEIRCRRFWRDKPWGRSAGAGRFWFGWAYGGVSDFGRSLIRPALIWSALIVLFAVANLALRGTGHLDTRVADFYDAPIGGYVWRCPLPPAAEGRTTPLGLSPWISLCPSADSFVRAMTGPCRDGSGESPVFEAFALSMKNAFVIVNWDRAEAARRTYGCLYGFVPTVNAADTPATAPRFPYVPGPVSLASLLQNIISAILIFLFLLALRNLLKLK